MIPKISRSEIQNFLKTERALLLLCMSIALIFWLLVQLSQQQKTVLKVPVNFSIPNGKILVQKPPEHLYITLESEGWNLFYRSFRGKLKTLNWKISEDELLSYEDLKDKIQDKISNTIEIKDISPHQVNLKLDKFSRRQVHVKMNGNIETVSQFQLSNDIQLLPNQVTITGPRSVLQDIEYIQTEKIEIQNLRQNQFGEINLQALKNKQVEYIPAKVNYMMTVEQFSEKTLMVPIQVQTDSFTTIHIMPSMAKVICTVGLSKYETLNPNFFEIIVQVDSAALANGNSLPLLLKKSPDWIRDIKISPQKVDFVIIE
jgi:YbbR domain-containing protein